MSERKIFVNKKSILEHLGKSPKDTRLVDRMIIRGEVVKVEGWYELVEREDVRELRDRIEELERELENKKFELELLEATSNPVRDEDLKEATTQWKYYEQLYEEEKKDKQNRIRKCFQWIKAKNPRADREEFRDWVMSDE